VPPAMGGMMHSTTTSAATTMTIATDDDLPNMGITKTPFITLYTMGIIACYSAWK